MKELIATPGFVFNSKRPHNGAVTTLKDKVPFDESASLSCRLVAFRATNAPCATATGFCELRTGASLVATTDREVDIDVVNAPSLMLSKILRTAVLGVFDVFSNVTFRRALCNCASETPADVVNVNLPVVTSQLPVMFAVLAKLN